MVDNGPVLDLNDRVVPYRWQPEVVLELRSASGARLVGDRTSITPDRCHRLRSAHFACYTGAEAKGR